MATKRGLRVLCKAPAGATLLDRRHDPALAALACQLLLVCLQFQYRLGVVAYPRGMLGRT